MAEQGEDEEDRLQLAWRCYGELQVCYDELQVAERRGSGAGRARSARTVAWNHLLGVVMQPSSRSIVLQAPTSAL